MLRFIRILLFIVAGTGLIMFGLLPSQRDLIYAPDPTDVTPASVGFSQAEAVTLTTEDRERLVVWHVPPRDGRPVVLFFHGDGDTLSGRVARFKKIVTHGIGIIAPAFRGYSGSTGSPYEGGLYRDGLAAFAFAVERYGAERIAVWGFALGSGVATTIAAQRPISRLILEAPFTSIIDVLKADHPYLSMVLRMKEQYRADERIRWMIAPILIVHGENDHIIPVELSEKLYALAPEPKTFVKIPNGHHTDLDKHGALEIVLRFLLPET